MTTQSKGCVMTMDRRVTKLEHQTLLITAQLAQQRDTNKRLLGMIAHNMLAVVRLELATWTDQITLVALEVKRDVTGSGTAKIVVNIAATAAMLAGNVLTAGGMTALGAVIVGTANVLTAAADEDPVALLSASATLGISSSRLHQGGMKTMGRASHDPDDDTQSAKDQAARESQEDEILAVSAEGANIAKAIIKKLATKEEEDEGYQLKRKTTAWIPHGAGGTNAITYDVQKAIVEFYYEAMGTLETEITAYARTGLLPPNSLLEKLSIFEGMKNNGDTDTISQLHPLTKHVVAGALKSLAVSGGTKYSSTAGNTFTRSSTTNKAKAQVKTSFKIMLDEIKTGKMSTAKIILDKVKTR
ncbi:MAG: hypothetical protein HOK97_00775 [Deltaproteobacteria bacterium]|nr:hypothetical protein [Deltaproteobacteria bacterium]MBT6488266.1 hypothetical protein [Deltaproteobacteria bacterium]